MKFDFKKLLSEKFLLILSCIAILVYYLPYIIPGENAHILVHDNLDSNLAWVKILLNNSAEFRNPGTNIPSVFSGIPASYIYPYYDFPLLLFKAFGMYWGYILNKILISYIGFWGMFLLLKHHFAPKDSPAYILILSALIFSLLPFWSFTASVLGLPFALYAFLNLRNKKAKVSDWVILIFFGMHSSLILSGIFLFVILGCIFLYDLIKTKKINFKYLAGIGVLAGVYFISQYPVIYSFLQGDITHRHEFVRLAADFDKSLDKTWSILYEGQYHAHSIHSFIFYPVLIILALFKGVDRKVRWILIFIAFTSLFYGFKDYGFVKVANDKFTDIIPLQMQRFHFLHPLFWYILLFVAMVKLALKYPFTQPFIAVFLCVQLYFVSMAHEVLNIKSPISFREFYAEESFDKIKQKINRPIDSYRVISVGLHPAIAQYNGFYTLDGYFPSYPLAYKHQFRTIIQSEIERNEKLDQYFNNWGSRCYAFSTEIGLDFMKNDHPQIDTLRYDYQAFKDLGGTYIFSSTSINEEINQSIQLLDSITAPDQYWDIYVYAVK